MIAYETWDRAPSPEFPRFWYAMLDECRLLGSGVVPDWEERLTVHFAREIEAGRMQWFVAQVDGRIAGTAAAILSLRQLVYLHGPQRHPGRDFRAA